MSPLKRFLEGCIEEDLDKVVERFNKFGFRSVERLEYITEDDHEKLGISVIDIRIIIQKRKTYNDSPYKAPDSSIYYNPQDTIGSIGDTSSLTFKIKEMSSKIEELEEKVKKLEEILADTSFNSSDKMN
jgi:hypothetical protein